MSSRPPPKKVRLACQRCRTRRIKCDSALPACSNCAKAGEVCLDVDGQNSHVVTPRNSAAQARARISWLEDIIRSRLPDVDLSEGPQLGSMSAPLVAEGSKSPSVATSSVGGTKRTQRTRRHDDEQATTSVDAADDNPFAEKAYSVAMELGRVTLNSDSLQKHYLGSSSGLLFTNLIGASPTTASSMSPGTTDASPFPDSMSNPFVEGTHSSHHDEAVQQRYRGLYQVLSQELPRRDDAMSLIQTYIQWIHPEFPVLNPVSLVSAVDALYACASLSMTTEPLNGRGWPISAPALGWNSPNSQAGEGIGFSHHEQPPMTVVAFIVFMVFNIAAIIKIRQKVYGFAPDRYYQTAMLFAPHCFSQISLPTTQALVLLIVHCLHTPADANLWILIHIGLANCVELGIHRETPPEATNDSDNLKQLRRFVFYTIYSLDRSVSSIQGRPLGFRDETFDVHIPSMASTPSCTAFSAEVTRYASHNFHLHLIMSDIKTQLYHLPVKAAHQATWPTDPHLSRQNIYDNLQAWRESMLSDTFNTHDSLWKLRLQVRFNTTLILLFQPSQAIRQPDDQALEAVYDSATCILRDYQLLHDRNSLHHGWRTVQNVFAAGAAMIYSFWTSSRVQERAHAGDLSRSLRTCTSLLSVGGEWWPSAKTSLANFGSVVDLTIQRIYSRPKPSKQRRLIRGRPGVSESRVAQIRAHPATGPTPEGAQTIGRHDEEDITNAQGSIRSGGDRAWDQLVPEQVDEWVGGDSEKIQAASTEAQWQQQLGGYDDASPSPSPLQAFMGRESFPEIEHFLADFDRGELSWNVPMNDMEDAEGLALDPNLLLHRG